MYNEKTKKATMKYLKENDRITVRAVKGTKERWQAAADLEGKSLTKFIKDTIEAKISNMERGREYEQF